jgi:hypothetical protein
MMGGVEKEVKGFWEMREGDRMLSVQLAGAGGLPKAK